MPITEVFEGKVSHIQVLDKDGKVDPKLDPHLPQELLLKMYINMLLARAFDEKCTNLQRQGRTYTYIPTVGQEAAQIGSCAALQPNDWMFPSFREQPAYLYRGTTMKDLLLYWMGSEKGMQHVAEHKNYTVTIPIATQTMHAAGVAWAAKIKGDPITALAYLGDGGTSEGDFHASMNFAGTFKLPLVLFCQNNQWAISVPRTKQTASKTIAQKALAYGFEGVQVDGNDILGVYHVAKQAIEKARRGDGPTLIEALTYRIGPHSTSDDPKVYRDDSEVKFWQERDPIKRFQAYLTSKGYWSPELEEKAKTKIKEEIEKAVDAAEKEIVQQDPKDMFQYNYSSITPNLQEQMDELLEYLKGKPQA